MGSRGDSYDNALAESVNGLYKAELVHRRGPWRGLEDLELAASNLRAHSESEVGAPVVTGGPHAAAISESSERQRAAKSRRCSARGIESPRPRRQRKYCRNSSNAEQKRAADAKLPKPRIG